MDVKLKLKNNIAILPDDFGAALSVTIDNLYIPCINHNVTSGLDTMIFGQKYKQAFFVHGNLICISNGFEGFFERYFRKIKEYLFPKFITIKYITIDEALTQAKFIMYAKMTK